MDSQKMQINKLPNHFNYALLNSTGGGLIALRCDGEIIFTNNSAQKILNQQTDKPLHKTFPDLWHKIEEAATTQDNGSTFSLRQNNKEYSATICFVKKEDDLIGYVCAIYAHAEIEKLAHDTKAFQDLSHEENAIINSSSDGLWICDADARVVRINPASERLNNIQAKDVIGRQMEEFVAEGIFDKSVTLEVIKHKKVTSLLQRRGNRTLLLTGSPVLDRHDKLIRVVVSERDITEISTLQSALEEQEALKNKYMEQVQSLQQSQTGQRQIIAKTPGFISVMNQALKVSAADSTVLILGESGVGKGLFADLIHGNSARKGKSLIKLNCGAIPETLIESELFGYDKGAFTGAQTSKAGQFELADGGTLFLDEVAELPLSAQVKLLRFLEDGCITRLGSTQKKKLDVRVLAATHRDLDVMIKDGNFRLDLYYRLKVIPLQIPALRERKDCIVPLLLQHLDYFGEKVGAKKRLAVDATDLLTSYAYPGNVRELINLCERLVVMTDTAIISVNDLPQEIVNSVAGVGWTISRWKQDRSLAEMLNEVEGRIYREAFSEYRNQYKVAAALGVSQATVARRLQKYGISQASVAE